MGVAEASKIIENSQRDVNIAFMNELAKIFNAMGIDTHDVIEAASTKWNFIKLSPGLVGGHCISVDPYYLIQKAQVYGVLPRVMSNARRLNDGMGAYVANQTIKCMNKKGVVVKDAKILILGITFKENCPDIRNTKIVDIYHTLEEYTHRITVFDPWADKEHVMYEYGIDVTNELPQEQFDAVIGGDVLHPVPQAGAVAHRECPAPEGRGLGRLPPRRHPLAGARSSAEGRHLRGHRRYAAYRRAFFFRRRHHRFPDGPLPRE